MIFIKAFTFNSKQALNITCRTSELTTDAITLFPNPNDGNATIDLGDEKSFITLVNDILGRQILHKESFGDNYQLNLGNQPKGVYMVSVLLENGDKKIFRMVIQ